MKTTPIKIAHISDIHWRGSSRHEEYKDSFELLFQQLRELQPDYIICTGDIFHTKTNGLTNEVVEKMAWMFRSLDKIAPTRTILGNHDGNLKNEQRQDAVSPIFEAIGENNRNILFKKSGNYIENFDDRINWCVFSCFDEEGWNSVYPNDSKINIALYHGSITGCIVGEDHRMMTGEQNISRFAEYDLGLFGDIHKMQFLSYKQDKHGKDKPWAAYPGSLIQQNFGEDQVKGFLLWTIHDKKDWNVEFKPIENLRPYITHQWQGSVDKTLNFLTQNPIKPNSKFRFTSFSKVSTLEANQIVEKLKKDYKVEEVTFKIDDSSKKDLDVIETGNIKISKESLKTNCEVIIDLYKDYISANKKKNTLTEEQFAKAEEAIKSYVKKAEEANPEESYRNIIWDLKSLKFNNVFRYGDDNSINFDALHGIVGIFGPNATGKSSIPGALMYGLYNATDRGPMKNGHVIHEGKKECEVKVQFECKDEQYFIERTTVLEETKKKSEELKTSTQLNLYKIDKEGNIQTLNEDDRDSTDKKIRTIIGSAEDFLMTSFASQGDINRFINEGSTKRKELISKFLNLDIFKTLATYSKDDLNESNAFAKKYTGTKFEEQIVNVKNNINEYKSLLSINYSNIQELEKKLEKTKHELLKYEKNNNFDSIHVLKSELDVLEKEHERIMAEKKAINLQIDELKEKLKNINLRIFDLSKEGLSSKVEKIQDVRKLIIELQNSYKVENNILEGQQKSIKKLDVVPCGDSFPTCEFIKDSHENKKLIKKQLEKVNSLKETVSDLELEIKSFVDSKIIEKYKEEKSLEEQKFKIQQTIELLEEKNNIRNLSILEEQKLKISSKISLLEKQINPKDLEAKKDLEELYKETSMSIKKLQISNNETLVLIGTSEERLKNLEANKQEMNDLIDRINVQQSIYNAFSKSGIPTMVLDSQLPAINDELNKILTGVSDFEIELGNSSTSNAMDIFITKNKSKRIIETASGMEKMICSLALRVALTNLSSMPKSNILIIDEGFGVLDEQNISLCLQMLTNLKKYYKTILIITHVSAVKEIADDILTIKDFSGQSYVSH